MGKRAKSETNPKVTDAGHALLMHDIRKAKEDVQRAQRRLADLKSRCRHGVVKRTEADEAACVICGDTFGWFCPESPDRACHYFTHGNGRTVDLITRDEADLGKRVRDQSEDSCLYCGDPMERK
jgi:hypothetical protein